MPNWTCPICSASHSCEAHKMPELRLDARGSRLTTSLIRECAAQMHMQCLDKAWNFCDMSAAQYCEYQEQTFVNYEIISNQIEYIEGSEEFLKAPERTLLLKPLHVFAEPSGCVRFRDSSGNVIASIVNLKESTL